MVDRGHNLHLVTAALQTTRSTDDFSEAGTDLPQVPGGAEASRSITVMVCVRRHTTLTVMPAETYQSSSHDWE